MPVSPAYRPDPRVQELGAEFADPVAAADFPMTTLRFRNDRAAASVGLDTLHHNPDTGAANLRALLRSVGVPGV